MMRSRGRVSVMAAALLVSVACGPQAEPPKGMPGITDQSYALFPSVA